MGLAQMYDDLVDRLLAALAEVTRSPTVDDEQAHNPNHFPAGSGKGGQFAPGPQGAKPTSVKAKLTKAALHELLSSGHPFTKKELLDIMGPEHKEITVSTWLSKFKSQKHAGDYGALDIQKLPNGSFQVVMPNGQQAPAMAPSTTSVESILAQAKPKMVADPQAQIMAEIQAKSVKKVVVPPEPMSQAEADKYYKADLAAAQEDLQIKIDNGLNGPQMHEALLAFKMEKAHLMAQWKAATTAKAWKAKEQAVFKADLQLGEDLDAAVSLSEKAKAFADWKINTVKEKAGNFPVPKSHVTPAPTPTVEHVGVEAVPVAAISYASLVPTSHEHISAADFTGDKARFKKEMSATKDFLLDKSNSAVANKQTVEGDLRALLKDKPNFQALLKRTGLRDMNGQPLTGPGSLESRLVQTWAGSSGGSNPLSNAAQLAIRDAFSMPKDDITTKALHVVNNASNEDEVYTRGLASLGIPSMNQTSKDRAVFKEALKEFAHAQYANTQTLFKAQGIKHVYLARGMKMGTEHDVKTGAAAVKLQPASSFSVNYGTASTFASGGTVFLTKVPVSQVLSTYMTGFGCTSEHEVVVLAHKQTMAMPVPVKESGGTGIVGALAWLKGKFS